MLRIALIMFLALSPVTANAAELTCTGESGPLLITDSEGMTLVQKGREQVLDLERWNICFGCVGFPRLDLGFKRGETNVRVFAAAQICDGAGDSATPERYCIADTSVRVGNTDAQTCSFPKGTTLGRLWTALTRSPPPERINFWWSYPAR